ncbi:putative N-acetyltransferase ycf52-like [Madurella mycetomatis]|uniref:N-acetyltransferase ycf52-like n=1 Tax=Madurella mycetomatis TaxID=100816 RepID=A0A175WHX0_9PEZI|nr:putative N-acetyltransferase ycf52-like [Madurella mycetomatis]
MIIRRATLADLEAMTWVLIGASPLDPVYPYRFPDCHLYPGEFAALCRRKCAEYLETSTVVVCEMPIDDFGHATQVVAFSAWDMPDARRPMRSSAASEAVEPTYLSSTPLPPTTIGSLNRQHAFRTACARNKSLLFDSRYQSIGGHVFLKILLCHPAYQRRGAGTALTSWGIAEARRLGVPTTVFASPMGLRLYRKLGFQEIGRFRVQLEGEGEFVEIPGLGESGGRVWERWWGFGAPAVLA